MKKKYVVANWKSNHLPEDARRFASLWLEKRVRTEALEVIVFPQAPMLGLLLSLFDGQGVKIGSQNHGVHPSGAYTGEISPSLVKNMGCEYALVGHSERRNLYAKDGFQAFENDRLCLLKVKSALSCGLKPVLCVGESLEERNRGETGGRSEKTGRSGFPRAFRRRSRQRRRRLRADLGHRNGHRRHLRRRRGRLRRHPANRGGRFRCVNRN